MPISFSRRVLHQEWSEMETRRFYVRFECNIVIQFSCRTRVSIGENRLGFEANLKAYFDASRDYFREGKPIFMTSRCVGSFMEI